MFSSASRPTNTIHIKSLPVSIGRSTILSSLRDDGPILDVRITRHGTNADVYVVFSTVNEAKKCLVRYTIQFLTLYYIILCLFFLNLFRKNMNVYFI